MSDSGQVTSSAAEIYDEKIFDGARFSDLIGLDRPLIQINSTDLSQGNRFTFSQGQFDVICSDLDRFPIARAKTAKNPMIPYGCEIVPSGPDAEL